MNPSTSPRRNHRPGREHGTPLYLVSRRRIVENYRRLDAALPAAEIFYAVKADPQAEILATLAGIGAGFDVASKGEIIAALAAGADPREDLIFADTVKDPKQIAYAAGIGLDDFTFDNESEITQIADTPRRQRAFAPGGLQRRQRGPSERQVRSPTRSGSPSAPGRARPRPGPRGISFHVGSQCLDAGRFLEALDTVRHVFDQARAAASCFPPWTSEAGSRLRYLDEQIDIPGMGEVIVARFTRLFNEDVRLVAEPGRAVVGDAVRLVTKVISESAREGRGGCTSTTGPGRQLPGSPALPHALSHEDQHPRPAGALRPGRPDLRSIDVFYATPREISARLCCRKCTWTTC